ncbi:MAG: hypothetical protein JWQ79_4008 [Mucilaginibacter sp.]|nr:hypothetical protein [Mucilaginibacter sp.]
MIIIKSKYLMFLEIQISGNTKQISKRLYAINLYHKKYYKSTTYNILHK